MRACVCVCVSVCVCAWVHEFEVYGSVGAWIVRAFNLFDCAHKKGGNDILAECTDAVKGWYWG